MLPFIVFGLFTGFLLKEVLADSAPMPPKKKKPKEPDDEEAEDDDDDPKPTPEKGDALPAPKD